MKKEMKYYKSLDGLPIWKFLYDENDNAIYIERDYNKQIVFFI